MLTFTCAVSAVVKGGGGGRERGRGGGAEGDWCSDVSDATAGENTLTYADVCTAGENISIRQHTSAYISIYQHTSAYVSIFSTAVSGALPLLVRIR